jgi:hypothetical protein
MEYSYKEILVVEELEVEEEEGFDDQNIAL